MLLKKVHDAGYAHATLDATAIADRAHHEAVIRFVVDAGPRCTFGAITISGVAGPLADAVSARITFVAGDRYAATAIDDTQAAIYTIGRFATVRVDADLTRDDAIVPGSRSR